MRTIYFIFFKENQKVLKQLIFFLFATDYKDFIRFFYPY
ncbi:hypothetical protein RCH33_2693 [Flavobacterium daejeonense]|nr:hypothetical protein RCH33_2693 [Flavobacterium daejeonense]